MEFGTGWVNFLATCIRTTDDQGRESVPFPSLRELTIHCGAGIVGPVSYKVILKQCRDMISLRRAAGFPIQCIKLRKGVEWSDDEFDDEVAFMEVIRNEDVT